MAAHSNNAWNVFCAALIAVAVAGVSDSAAACQVAIGVDGQVVGTDYALVKLAGWMISIAFAALTFLGLRALGASTLLWAILCGLPALLQPVVIAKLSHGFDCGYSDGPNSFWWTMLVIAGAMVCVAYSGVDLNDEPPATNRPATDGTAQLQL